MDKPPKEVEWDVPGFFPARATILFGGRKGEGKSYLLQALGKASRKGSELIKHLPVVKKGFSYLVREGAQELYDQRFREFEFDYRKQSRKFQLCGSWMEPIPPKILDAGVRCVKNWYGEEKALLLEPHWDGGKFWFTGGEDTEAEDRWARDKETVLSQTSVTEWRSRTTILEALEGEIGGDRVIEILDSESGQNGKLRAKRSSKPGAPFAYRRVREAEADSSSDSGEDE